MFALRATLKESFPMADDLQSNTFLTTTSASSKSLISAPPSPGSPQSPFLSTSHPPPSATGLKSLKSLIHAISSRNADESTFMSLIRTVRDADISDSAFSRGDRGGEEETDTTQLLNCVIDFVSDERLSSELRETCIIAFTQIIMLQSLAFEGFLLKILRAAFVWRVSKSAPVASSANELLLTISTVFKPSNIFETTSAYLAELSEFSIEVTSAFYLLSESLFLFNRNEVYIDACMHEQTQNNNGKHDNTGRRFNASKFDDNMRGDGERTRTFSQIQKRKGFLVPGSGPRMGHGDKGI
ncbi:hypothetical protein BKA69DRAFT_745690 [Paraphysoderma sedebokerense]|nr:hypothetical protein BKA69DRAFT_745690 [Paraphysoderma sedebokerense]